MVNDDDDNQDCLAMSSAKAEYVALSASCAQSMWMRTQLKDYGFDYNKIPLYYDSQPATALSCNPEVILNGDSPTPTMIVDGVVQPVTPTTAKQRLAKKNELKAQGTLLMALPNKHQLKFNIHKDAKSLMEAIEKRFVSAVTSVSAASNKVLVSTLPNVDNLSNTVIYSFFASQSNSSQLDNDDLKQIDADDLEEMDLKWQMAMLTMRAMRFLQRTGRNLGANGTTSIGFDMSKVECYNCHRRWHFVKECRSPKDTKNKETQRRNVPVETSTSNALVSHCDGVGSYDWSFQAMKNQQTMPSWHSPPQVLPVLIMSSKSDVSMPTSPVHDSSESDVSMPTSPVHDRPYASIIEDWVSDSKDEYEDEPMPTQKVPSFVQTNEHVKTLRPSIKPVKHHIPAENLRKDILKSRGHKHSWNKKACFVCKSLTYLIKECDYYEKKMVQKPIRNHAMRGNHQHYARKTHPNPHRHVVPTTVLTRSRLVTLTTARPVTTVVPQNKVQHQRLTKHGVKGNWIWKPKCPILDHVSRHSSASMTLKQFDYTDAFGRSKINRGYVAFGGNPKGGKIIGKGNQPNSSACIQEHLDADKAWEGNVHQYVLFPLWSTGSKDPQNTDVAATFEVKELESDIHVSPSSSAKTKKHDEKSTKEAKGKSRVELSIGVRDLSDDFEEFFDNSTNGVNASSTPVTTIGPNSSNRTNTFNMPALEDITYSDDEEAVGAEADFFNLETNITISPIPTTRVHKDHHVTQIIGDLSSAPQIRSMARMVKEQELATPKAKQLLYQVDAKDGIKVSAVNEGFEHIIDFLHTSVIQYALVVNPTIYVSCIKQFWSSVSLKKTNDVVRLLALIDRRKVSITEDTVRQALRLDDANSIDCQPNEEIFAELARMCHKKPSTKLTFYKVFLSAQ
nr:hypothetical protein [Tanacetum cinerariifolium]